MGTREDWAVTDKAQDYRDECERVEVERRFCLAKRKCGMGLITARLRETAAHVIALSVIVQNLRRIQHDFLRRFSDFFWPFGFVGNKWFFAGKIGFVQ